MSESPVQHASIFPCFARSAISHSASPGAIHQGNPNASHMLRSSGSMANSLLQMCRPRLYSGRSLPSKMKRGRRVGIFKRADTKSKRSRRAQTAGSRWLFRKR